MSEFRLNKTDTARYSSIEELCVAWGKKPRSKKPTNEKKLEEKKADFLKKNKLEQCSCCKSPLKHVAATNVFICSNEKCKGFQKTFENEDGSKYTVSYPFIRTLGSAKGTDIACNLFD